MRAYGHDSGAGDEHCRKVRPPMEALISDFTEILAIDAACSDDPALKPKRRHMLQLALKLLQSVSSKDIVSVLPQLQKLEKRLLRRKKSTRSCPRLIITQRLKNLNDVYDKCQGAQGPLSLRVVDRLLDEVRELIERVADTDTEQDSSPGASTRTRTRHLFASEAQSAGIVGKEYVAEELSKNIAHTRDVIVREHIDLAMRDTSCIELHKSRMPPIAEPSRGTPRKPVLGNRHAYRPEFYSPQYHSPPDPNLPIACIKKPRRPAVSADTAIPARALPDLTPFMQRHELLYRINTSPSPPEVEPVYRTISLPRLVPTAVPRFVSYPQYNLMANTSRGRADAKCTESLRASRPLPPANLESQVAGNAIE